MRVSAGGGSRPSPIRQSFGRFGVSLAAAPIRSYANPAPKPVYRAPAKPAYRAPARQAYTQRVAAAPRRPAPVVRRPAPVVRRPAPAPVRKPAAAPARRVAPQSSIAQVVQRLKEPSLVGAGGNVSMQPLPSQQLQVNPEMVTNPAAPPEAPPLTPDPQFNAQNGNVPPDPTIDPTGATPVTAPPPPSEEDWLQGDTTYQDQVAQLRQAYAQYVAQQQNDQGNYDQSYQGQLRDLSQQQQRDFAGLEDDYASRGLLHSGLYGKAYSDLQNQYDTQKSKLESGKQSYLSQLAEQLAGFTGQQDTTQLSAKQEAIARRAAQYGLGG